MQDGMLIHPIATTLLLLVCTSLASIHACHRDGFQSGQGDAGQFILSQAITCGAKPLRTTELPAITESWRYSQDDAGVVLRLDRTYFDAVESFLEVAFGEPRFRSGRIGGYRLSARGGGIQFTYDEEATQVIVICPHLRTPASPDA